MAQDIIEANKPTSQAGGFALLWSAFSLVPKLMYDTENRDMWLNFLRRRIPRDQQVEVCDFPDFHCACLYETKQPERQHIICLLLQKASQHKLEAAIYAIRQADKLAVVCVRDGELQLANIYEAATKEQLLFWILNIYKQLQLPDTTPLYIQCGDGTRKLLFSHLDTRELIVC